MELRVLGSLQVLVDGAEIPVGGAKQRTVLATLLLRVGEVVPVERLIDEIWGDDPPPSAAHSLESYVSRLRQLLNGHGPVLVRRGSGYGLELGDATLDATAFETLVELAGEAADGGDSRLTSELARDALSYWRGPVLGDVTLGPAGRAAAERLEELRLHTLELRFDAELTLGRDKELVSELQGLVTQNPYREQIVAQLMLALYRAGRQAEALDVYEQTRRRLDSDLGLQPSTELRALSGQIVRQDPELRRPAHVHREPSSLPGSPQRARRLAALVAAGTVIAAAMALTASGGAPTAPAAGGESKRIVLVYAADRADPSGVRRWTESWRVFGKSWGYEPELLAVDESAAAGDDAEGLRERLEFGRFGLVAVMGDGPVALAVQPLVRELPATAFVFIDASLADLSLRGARNASAIRFRDEQSSELAGYASALAPPRFGDSDARIDSVSIVAGGPPAHARRVATGFVRGLKRGSRTARVTIDYVRDATDPTACERIANRRIDAGADVVYGVGGSCGRGAIAVARARSVWAVGAIGDDRTEPEPAVLTATMKSWPQAVNRAVTDFHTGRLPFGRDDELGLEDDYAVLIYLGTSGVPEQVWSKVTALCSTIRERAAASTS
jgi:DNA-binding SARP family transcriptional activator